MALNRQNPRKLDELMARPGTLALNAYCAKNFCRLGLETISGFGRDEDASYYDLLPVGVDLQRQKLESMRYRIETARRCGMDTGLIKEMENHMASVSRRYEVLLGTERMWVSPVV